MLKIRLLILFIVNFGIIHGQNYWLSQTSPINKELFSCMFIDTSYGWVAGDSGIILNTTNAGVNWNIQNSGITAYKIDDVYFLNQRLGWAISNDYLFIGTFFLNTTNGGANWITSRFPDSSIVFNCIHFVDSLKGFITGQSGLIYKTTNGGTNWLRCIIDSVSCPYLMPKYDIYFVNAQTGYSCGGATDYVGLTWRTTNSGLNWDTYCLTAEPLYEIRGIGLNKVASMGGDFEFGANVVYSDNNGSSWSEELTLCQGTATGFSLRTPAECWVALSFSNRIAYNTDSMKPGTIWNTIFSPGNVRINDIEFTSSTLGWAFGADGSIFKYNTAIIGINGNQSNFPASYNLYQNYPNPFNPNTIIKYSIPETEFVIITIYDLTGKEIRKYNEGMKLPGIYEIKINGEGFSSGLYFYKIEAGGFVESKKMVLIK